MLAWVWVLLLVLTLSSYFGLSQLPQRRFVALVLVATWIKGQLLVDHFMGLRRVHWLWRGLLALYLVGVMGALGLAFLLD